MEAVKLKKQKKKTKDHPKEMEERKKVEGKSRGVEAGKLTLLL